MTRRILFVDDDRNVLDGLQDVLRKQRKDWDMSFAQDATAALDAFDRAPFDVIVADMCMPGIDGAELLARVKEEHPRTARIILSGQVRRDVSMRMLPVAHQFLSKPCDAKLLRSVIERLCEAQRLLSHDAILAVVGRLDKLPSAPRVYHQLTRAAANADVGLSDIAGIVEKDPAVCAKVLQLVNSAYFGLAKRITSIRQAATYLGIELLKALTLSAHVLCITMRLSPVAGFSLERLQDDSLRIARLAKAFLPERKRAEAAFTAGILHDVGKIVIALAAPDRFAEIVRHASTTGLPIHAVEQDRLGVTHAQVGAYLLGVWGLPLDIVEVVAHHHRPRLLLEGPHDVLAAVHVADALVDSTSDLDVEFLHATPFHSRLDQWRAIAEQDVVATSERRGSITSCARK